MEIVEIAELYKHIKKHYPFFDASIEKVKEDLRYLRDFPSEAAWQNIERHILTETSTPGIAHIRGRLGDQLDSKRSREDAAAYFYQLDSWRNTGSSPPEGYWDRIRQMLRQKGGNQT